MGETTRRLLGNGANLSYASLDEEAAQTPVGADGLLSLETFQGSRTPSTDPFARGAMEAAGYSAPEVHLSGGASRSAFWLQMHTDAIGKPVLVGEQDNCCLLGAAVLAAVGAGVHPDVSSAVDAMVRVSKRVEPDETRAKDYAQLHRVYSDFTSAVVGTSHALATHSYRDQNNFFSSAKGTRTTIEPSILAADFQAIGEECALCLSSGCDWVHIDMFDGSEICQGSFSFGPTMVASIHRRCPELKLDVHIAAANPSPIIENLLDSGAKRVTLQLEMFNDTASAVFLLRKIRDRGIECIMHCTLDPA